VRGHINREIEWGQIRVSHLDIKRRAGVWFEWRENAVKETGDRYGVRQPVGLGGGGKGREEKGKQEKEEGSRYVRGFLSL